MDVQSSLNTTQTSSSSPYSAVAPILSPNPSLPHPAHPPTNEEIDAVIQQATSSVSSDGRHVPLKDTRTQLFVGNLPYRVRWQDLKDLFRKAGTVLRADVSLGPDNRSRGHGTVLLATAEDAGRAVDLFNGYSWQSRVLEVRLDRLPSDFDNFSTSASGYHSPVLVGTHAPVIPLRPLYPFPTSLPPPINPLLSTSFVPQIPLRGALDESYPDHSTVFGHDRPTTVGCISRNLFVGNLPFHCQWQDLKDLFRQAGTILRADVALGQDGRSRGFGTVVFATEHDAERAVNMFNGYEYNGRPLKVHYDKFMPSVGQSLTAPSSPLITSPFSGVNATPLTSMSNVSVRPSSSRSTPLPLTHHPHSLDHTAYNVNQVKTSTSPSPLNVFPSILRSQPHAGPSHLGTAPVHQLVTHISTGPGLFDPKDTNPSSLRNESPSVGIADLPTPPSSSAGVPSAKGSRVSSPPLHLSQPLLKQDPPSHPPPRPPTVSVSLPTTASTSSTYPEPTHSSQLFVSSSQRETQLGLEQTSPPSRQRAQTHPAHPGPISLPPPSAFVVPAAHNFSPMSPVFAPGISMSPLQRPGVLPIPSPHAHPHSPLNRPKFPHARSFLQHPTHTPSHHITPSGLPPITPSMPSFQFVPGPPMLSHLDHSAVTLSPVSTMSPGAFWGRPGENPLSNAAVGAPVTKGQNKEEPDYFSCASADASKGKSYFLPLSQTGGSLVDEMLRDEPGNTNGIGEGRAPLVPVMENGICQEVSTSSGSSGRRSANERISNSGVDGVIEQLHRSLNTSLPESTSRAEKQDHSRTLSPFPHPPTRRSESDPAQEQGQRPSGKGLVRRASFTEGGHNTASQRSDVSTKLRRVKMNLHPGE